jgi:hypothetical protein
MLHGPEDMIDLAGNALAHLLGKRFGTGRKQPAVWLLSLCCPMYNVNPLLRGCPDQIYELFTPLATCFRHSDLNYTAELQFGVPTEDIKENGEFAVLRYLHRLEACGGMPWTRLLKELP